MLFTVKSNYAQTTINGSLIHDGKTRTYSFYVPASYTPGRETPMIIGLHGTSSNGAEFAQHRDFKPVADTANVIIVNPDGSSLLGIRFWNYGNVLGSNVDDVGFLEALIDKIAAQYTVNRKRIYCVGMSNGSFMSYYMACRSRRFAAIVGVTGSMSVNMLNSCSPVRPTPVMHIHGTDDGTNPYNGTSSMAGIEETIRFWVNQNHCGLVPQSFPIPNTNTADGSSAIRYVYSGGVNGHSVELIKVNGGGHSWPGSPIPGSAENTCMDFNATQEIWRFLRKYEIADTSTITDTTIVNLKTWPNPTMGMLNMQSANHPINQVMVFDLLGRLLLTVSRENMQTLDLSNLKEGKYIARFSGKGFNVGKVLVVMPH